MDEKLIARFWAKVDKSGPVPAHCPEIGECWLWTGFRLPVGGYGRFSAPGVFSTRSAQAHRVSYVIANGNFDEALDILHRCDNPPCVNPAHLFSGNDRDNTNDKMSKRRHGFGESHAKAVFTEQLVLDARASYRSGESSGAMARRLNVNQSALYDAIVGRSWGHIPGAVQRLRPPAPPAAARAPRTRSRSKSPARGRRPRSPV